MFGSKSMIGAMIRSFYAAEPYRDSVYRWRGIGFSYLLLLTFITMLPLFLLFYQEVTDFFDREGPDLIAQMPEIVIQNGKASVRGTMEPVEIRTSEGFLVGVVDTTNSHSVPADGLGFVVSEHQLILNIASGVQEVFSFERLGTQEPVVLTRDSYAAMVDNIGLFLWLGLLPGAVLGMALMRVFMTVVFSLASLIMSAFLRVPIDYPALLRFTAVAMTPAVVVEVWLGWMITNLMFVTMAISLGYIYFGLRVLGREQPLYLNLK